MSIFDTIRSSLRSLLGVSDESESAPSESAESDRSEGTVSVERERGEADASTEARVKGAESEVETTADADESGRDAGGDDENGEGDDGNDVETDDGDDAVAAETDASASTGTLVDEDAGKEPAEVVETAGEGEEAVGADDLDTDSDDAHSASSEEAVAAETDAAASTGTLVDEETGKEPAEAVVPTESESVDGDGETAEADDEDDDTDAEPAGAEDDRPVERLKGIGPAYAERLGNAGIETVGELAVADAEEVAADIDVSEKRVSDWIDRARDAE
ncbi:helix-hairpin-helix domain-containing protein [Halobellus sp. GM3]|uniref:helix-hairpin-helix domain-containing protein n=1 Tax=Halobellus sp. GM3 TaxID=3458410 RepID=UPI00403D599F